MTLTQLKHTSKSFNDTHTVKVKDLKTGGGGTKHPWNAKPPKYFVDFQKQMLEFIKEQREFNQYVLDCLKETTLNKY